MTVALRAHVTVVDGDAQPLGFDPHPLDARRASSQGFAERTHHRLLGNGLGWLKAMPGPSMTSPWQPAYTAPDTATRCVTSPRSRPETTARRTLGVRASTAKWCWTSRASRASVGSDNVRRERAVVVGHEEQATAATEPRAEPLHEHFRIFRRILFAWRL